MNMTSRIHDIAIIGGGINGCGIARDAADRLWQLTLEDLHSGARNEIAARAVVNAAGPWVVPGAGLSEREVDYLVANEWTESADDILWRRTKLGLRLSLAQREALAGHLAGPRADRSPAGSTSKSLAQLP